MNDNDYEMLDAVSPSTSKAPRLSASNNTDDVVDEDEEHQDSTLWSVDDDTMFFPRGLTNHSAGKGKAVFVTWNENYLLNFVFKTSSKSKKTTLIKVRLSMPVHNDEPEEIQDMLILEMNTLLLMKSGRVYYFSSVKSIHIVPWLKDVRCITSCPHTQFAVIRFFNNTAQTEQQQTKQLLLEVYQDVPQLGKCANMKDVLRHSYDISFDLQNLFNCNWTCERYILLSLITDQENVDFLRGLVSIGNCLHADEEKITLELNQEVHIFTISGNMFVLVGAMLSESECPSSNPKVEDYTIQLLNTYATTIEYIRIDYRKHLLMVLLGSGHMDIWYKSLKMFGSIRHLSHEISYFTHCDYNSSDNTFYLTKPEEVTQLRIITNKDQGKTECMITEIHKAVGGMIACTWVENLHQLICLSLNNIFYRLCFDPSKICQENVKETDVEYENLNVLYALTTKKIKELLSRAQIVNDLIEQPSRLHDAVEREWQKQQLLNLGFKRKLWKNILKCHLEYHMDIPTIQYFAEDLSIVRAAFDRDTQGDDQNIIYCLIYLTLTRKDSIFLSIIQTALWQLQITVDGESLQLQVPSDMLNKRLCFVIKYSRRNMNILPDYSIKLLTFVKHCSVYLCINFDVDLIKNANSYRHLFSYGVRQIPLFRNKLDIDYLIEEFNRSTIKPSAGEVVTPPELKQIFKIPKHELLNVLKVFHNRHESILNTGTKLYFLRQHGLHLEYDENQQLLIITAEQPGALYYIKVFLMHELKSYRNVDLTDSKSNIHQSIMQYQSDIERLYGCLVPSEYMDDDSGTLSLHLENLLKIYSKLRCEFSEILS